MQQVSSADLRQILALYEQRDTSSLASQPDSCALIAQRALVLGEPLLAYDMCAFALAASPDHLRLRQLQGLALARSGAFEQAQQLLEKIYAQGHRDEETVGILARTYKDLWSEQRNSPAGEANLRRSQQLYEESYAAHSGYWSGINAATLASVLGEERSGKLATKVRDECLAAEAKMPDIDRWRGATLGEASLLLGDQNSARSWYLKALDGAGQGDRVSMRRNARLAIEARGLDAAFLDEVFAAAMVAVFSGHRIDESDRAGPRFPEKATAAAIDALKGRLARSDVRIGYASAAAGGDILFHEAMLDSGYETHVILPEPAEEFAAKSVTAAGSSWLDRFHRVLDRASSVIVHSGSMSGDIGYVYNNWMTLGLARSRAR